MDDRPLVSILTPTWRRADLLRGAIASVRIQTHRPIEHVIVVDGPDDEKTWLALAEEAQASRAAGIDTNAVELGRNWSTFLPDAYCAAPITVAMLLARGDYHSFLADDERMDPDHIESMVALLESSGADFAYGRVRMWRKGEPETASYVIGAYPPTCGQITSAVYRAEVLKRGLYVFGDDRTSDWATIKRWLDAGARAAFLDRETMTHRVDR